MADFGLRANMSRDERVKQLLKKGNADAKAMANNGKFKKVQRTQPSMPKFKCMDDGDASGG
jgi:hypothetical protein